MNCLKFQIIDQNLGDLFVSMSYVPHYICHADNSEFKTLSNFSNDLRQFLKITWMKSLRYHAKKLCKSLIHLKWDDSSWKRKIFLFLQDRRSSIRLWYGWTVDKLFHWDDFEIQLLNQLFVMKWEKLLFFRQSPRADEKNKKRKLSKLQMKTAKKCH